MSEQFNDTYSYYLDLAEDQNYKGAGRTQTQKLRALRDEFGYNKECKRVSSEEEQDGDES